MVIYRTYLAAFAFLALVPAFAFGNPSTTKSHSKHSSRVADAALLRAAEDGNAKRVNALLAQGADPNSTDSDGNTPLFSLAALGSDLTQVGEMLLAHGAQIDRQNKHGETPLLANICDPRAVRFLLSHGADSHIRDFAGNTPLIAFANQGPDRPAYRKVAPLLLAAGVRINDTNHAGETALIRAAQGLSDEDEGGFSHDSIGFVQYLIAQGADVKARTRSGQNALMHAAVGHGTHIGTYEPNDEIASILLAHGADVNVQDHHGNTALLLAASAGDTTLVRLLLEHGAHIDQTDHLQRTPLIRAAAYDPDTDIDPGDFHRTIKLLLARGANRAQRDSHGRTAQDWARSRHHPDLVLLLQQRSK